MKSNILTNYQTTQIPNNVFKNSFIDKYLYQNKSVENIPTPNIIEEKPFQNVITIVSEKVSKNVYENKESIPILNQLEVDGIMYKLEDTKSFKNINQDVDVDKIDWLNNCITHQNVIENTNIIFNHSTETYHIYVKSILKKFHNNELILDSELYSNIGNTLIYSLFNINSECVKDVIKLFSDTYSFNISNQTLSEMNKVDTLFIEDTKNLNDSIAEEKNEITNKKIEEQKSFFRNYRKTIMVSTAVCLGGLAVAKLGFPAIIGTAGTKIAMKAVEDLDVSALIPTTDDKSSYKVDHEFWKRIALFFKSK